ncbi:NAD(P)/FAD-dependent oxidoreductase [Urechidicola sp. KH5]
MNKSEKILIIGAGLCGSLLALRLAQRGYDIQLRESRPDLRKHSISAGRSINLAFSNRGMKALEMAGVLDKVMHLCIPMHGRMVHTLEQSSFMAPYSGRSDEYINSISRGELNGVLLTEVEKYDNVEVIFESPCSSYDQVSSVATFSTKDGVEIVNADIVIGADGAGSVVRNSIIDKEEVSVSFLDHGYKELRIPPSENGGFRTEQHALHIWPRGQYMLIALPNLDGSFTVTLFLENKGAINSFEYLNSEIRIRQFFEEQFPDALELMPNLIEEFKENPVGLLGTVKSNSWVHGSTLLIGDAAHAIVPFYGQGMNASFEDVLVLDKFIDKYNGDWETIFAAYAQERKQDADAIADLAVENFYEMRDHVANPDFKRKRAIELELEKSHNYYSKYSMVTFREDIPYAVAKAQGNYQDKVLLDLIRNGQINAMSNEEILSKVQNYEHE